MEEENISRTEISALGEFGLIDHLTADFDTYHSETIKGVGDDAAVIDAGTLFQLVSTDMLVEGIHYDLVYTPLKHLGFKSVIANLSDIYAMNGTPKQITVSISVSNKFSVEAVTELYAGILIACEKYKIDLIGGDTTAALQGSCISITVLGEVEKEKITYRNGAAEKELICVSGDLGGAFLGLQLLEREKRIFLEHPGIQPDLEGNDYLIGRQLKPEARRDVIDQLAELEIIPTSMIDISDGLASELHHLCKHSQLGCVIHEEKIPLAEETKIVSSTFRIDPVSCALTGGEDYELLFTIRQSDYDKLKTSSLVSVIGYMENKESGLKLISKSGKVRPLTVRGWDSFENKPE